MEQQTAGVGVDQHKTPTPCRLNYLLVVVSGIMIPVGSTFLLTVHTYIQANKNAPRTPYTPSSCPETTNTPSNSFCSNIGYTPAADYSRTDDWRTYLKESVTQTIEGNKEEKKKSEDKYTEMEEYLERWVKNNGNDNRMKKLCSNRHHLCVYWASIGECTSNPVFMDAECMLACQQCHELVQVFV